MEIAGELRALARVIAPLETAKLYAPVHANAPTDSVKARARRTSLVLIGKLRLNSCGLI